MVIHGIKANSLKRLGSKSNRKAEKQRTYITKEAGTLESVFFLVLFVLIQKRVMAPFTYNVLGLMRVKCRTRFTLLSFAGENILPFKPIIIGEKFL